MSPLSPRSNDERGGLGVLCGAGGVSSRLDAARAAVVGSARRIESDPSRPRSERNERHRAVALAWTLPERIDEARGLLEGGEDALDRALAERFEDVRDDLRNGDVVAARLKRASAARPRRVFRAAASVA